MKVRDIMTRNVTGVRPTASIVEVARQMGDSGVGVIPVCENGKFYGIITERDVVMSVSSANGNEQRAVALAHHRNPMVSSGVEASEAARMMTEHGVRVLPVVQNGKFIGLLTLDNLARESLALAAMVFAKTMEQQSLVAA
jgi:CBS domain-containing protein